MKKVSSFVFLVFVCLNATAANIELQDIPVLNDMAQSIDVFDSRGIIYFKRNATAQELELIKKYWGAEVKPGAHIDLVTSSKNPSGPLTQIACINNETGKIDSTYLCINAFNSVQQTVRGMSDRSNSQKEEDFKRNYLQFLALHKLDTVSKVLNYSECANDSGCDKSSWYPVDVAQCIYAKASYSAAGFVQQATRYNLNRVDPKTIWVGIVPTGNNFMPGVIVTKTDADVIAQMPLPSTQAVMASDPIISRISNGWKVVYKNYCRGARNEF